MGHLPALSPPWKTILSKKQWSVSLPWRMDRYILHRPLQLHLLSFSSKQSALPHHSSVLSQCNHCSDGVNCWCAGFLHRAYYWKWNLIIPAPHFTNFALLPTYIHLPLRGHLGSSNSVVLLQLALTWTLLLTCCLLPFSECHSARSLLWQITSSFGNI